MHRLFVGEKIDWIYLLFKRLWVVLKLKLSQIWQHYSCSLFLSVHRGHPIGYISHQLRCIVVQDVWLVRVKGCVPSRCVGVSAGSWISLLCRGLPVDTMWTELKCGQTYRVSCSHALPCWMVLALGMPCVGFRWIACERSKATECKGTLCCNSIDTLSLLFWVKYFVDHFSTLGVVVLC